jgi:hypothetical protein
LQRFALPILILVVLLAFGCAADDPSDPSVAPAGTSGEATGNPADRQAFFGDLHVHTTYSYDAFVFGTRAGPDEAYEFAKGNPIEHPAGFELKLDRPLDFQGVSDHANYLGMLPAMQDPDQAAYNHPAAETVRNAETIQERRGIFAALQPYVRFMKDADPSNREQLDKNVVRSAWSEIVGSANRHYEPGVFTTFIAYEYTSAGAGGLYENLHRNVVFRGDEAPDIPFSRLDSYNPEDLWARMDVWRDQGYEAIAIPHNTNGSGGRMFEYEYFEGGAIDQAYSDLRRRNEPIVEITQTKGTSETHPALSPNDEWADFQVVQYYLDRVNNTDPISIFKGGYWRDALLTGLEMEERLGVNPYALGAVGSSDSHVSAGSYEEDNRFSSRTNTPQARGSAYREEDGGWENFWTPRVATHGTGGLAGVWADGNTRAAIFDALKRRESFATSGTRIRVRFFGGFGLDEAVAEAADPIAAAYEAGVPMGADLEGGNAAAPSFLVWALRDPENAWLQRAQVIKGWLEDGEAQERVYDVVCSDGLEPDPETHRCDDNGAQVNLDDCSISRDKGAVELRTTWTDPDFDPGARSFYYVRVLENPTCRWSTWDALSLGIEPNPDLHATHQERAWSSPIWYTP